MSWNDVAPDRMEIPRQRERDRMIDQQIITRGVNDSVVLTAMRRIPRHRFVQEEDLSDAYEDSPLSIGYRQTISQPYMAAYMTAALQLKPSDKVLEIGTGSGYQTAILAHIVSKVFTIEIVKPLAERAERILCDAGCENITVRTGDGYHGWPEEAPFEAIMLTAAPDHIPQVLMGQLAINGRMVLPIGEHRQNISLIHYQAHGYTETELISVKFVPMTGKAEEGQSSTGHSGLT